MAVYADPVFGPIQMMHFWLKLIQYTSRGNVGLLAGIPEETYVMWEDELQEAATQAFHVAKRVS